MKVLRLASVIGQEPLARLLMRLVRRDRLPQAILFDGQPGSGRQTLARCLAAALLCPNPVEGDACGVCQDCRLVAEGNHPDLVSLPHDTEEDAADEDRAEAAREQLKTESIRDLIEARAWESPLRSSRRVFLLPAVERLQRGEAKGANALLKVLEEPPARAHFILTTASAAGLLATIRSRSQVFRLHPLTVEDLKRVLIAGGMSVVEASVRAPLGGGSHRGLWGEEELKGAPVPELRALVEAGHDSARIADLVGQLASDPRNRNSPGGQRRACRAWLLALQQDFRRDLSGSSGLAAVDRLDRIQRALRDLALNLPPRLVLEGLALTRV